MESERFWVRGIGTKTVKQKGVRETFSVDDLWGLAKQFEKFHPDSEGRDGRFMSQYRIPFFTGSEFRKNSPGFKVLSAVVGEDRIRVLIEPIVGTQGGDAILWCKDSEVPLYCYASGYVSGGEPRLDSFNIVLNSASCSISAESPLEGGEEFDEDEFLFTYPDPYNESWGVCRVEVSPSAGNDSYIEERTRKFFINNFMSHERGEGSVVSVKFL